MNINEIWNNETDSFEIPPQKFFDFLKEYKELCIKHNVSVSHEDGHGGFILENFDEVNINWLNSASYNFKSLIKDDSNSYFG